MLLALTIFYIICLIIGVIVCALGLKSNNILYKGGLFFFLIKLIERIYYLIISVNADKIIHIISEKGLNTGYWVMLLNVPSSILNIVAINVLIVFLVIGINANRQKW